MTEYASPADISSTFALRAAPASPEFMRRAACSQVTRSLSVAGFTCEFDHGAVQAAAKASMNVPQPDEQLRSPQFAGYFPASQKWLSYPARHIQDKRHLWIKVAGGAVMAMSRPYLIATEGKANQVFAVPVTVLRTRRGDDPIEKIPAEPFQSFDYSLDGLPLFGDNRRRTGVLPVDQHQLGGRRAGVDTQEAIPPVT